MTRTPRALALSVGLLALAPAQGQQGARPLAIVGATVFDGTGTAPKADQTILLRGDRIAAIGPTGSVAIPPGARILSGAGRFVVPGFWDLHVHLTAFDERALPLYIANGVTSVRDAGGVLSRLRSMQARVDRGELIGPRLTIGGPILDGPATVRRAAPVEKALRVGVPDSATAIAIVDSLAALGVDHIKVHSELGRAAYFAVLDQVRLRGLPVIGHIPDEVTASEAIRAGQRSIEHQFAIPIANSGRVAELTARLGAAIRAYRDSTSGGRDAPLGTHHVRLVVDDTALASFDVEAARRFATEAASARVWLDPTLAVLRVAARANEDSIARPTTLRYLPPAMVRRLPQEPIDPKASPATIEAGRRKLERWLAAFRELHRAGARFTTGTDVGFKGVVPGFSLHDELELLTRVGLTPAEALVAATKNGAEATGSLDRAGTLEVGKVADLLVLTADPLVDIRNTRRIAAVVSRGRLYQRPALDSLLTATERAARRGR